MIVSEGDTLVTLTSKQFSTILFSFSYIRHLEKRDTIALSELKNLAIQIHHRDSIIALNTINIAHRDSIALNLGEVIKKQKKQAKKEKLKSTFTYLGLGILAGIEAGIITYLLIR